MASRDDSRALSEREQAEVAPLTRRIAVILGPTFVLVLMSFVLPDIALDSGFADIIVRIADSATWEQLPFLCITGLMLLASRPGPSARQRTIEALVVVLLMLVALAGNATLNENYIKPAMAIPRPNLTALSEAGALSPEVAEVREFYALGSKEVRREFLAEKLEPGHEPALSPRVRDHWIHETGWSFPSGHATASMTFASLMVALGLYWLTGWRQRIVTVSVPIWAVCVVYSRPLLEVHTGVDVTAGTLIGFAWGLGSFALIRWITDEFRDDD